MTWPVENVLRILALESKAHAGNKAAATAAKPKVSPDEKVSAGENDTEPTHWANELIIRHLRLATYLVVSIVTYATWPLDRAHKLQFDWVFEVLLRNLFVEFLFYEGWHSFLYRRQNLVLHKFNAKDQYADGSTNLFRERCLTTLGFFMSSFYEIAVLHLWATNSPLLRPCYLDFFDHPTWSIGHLLLVSYWRDFHFYFCHRVMHPWGFKICGIDPGLILYLHVHKIHHLSYNPGPWSGLSMHPVEHLAYYSCTLLNVFFSLHPLHFLFNKYHADLSPAAGHDGFDKPAGGSLFHFLHHSKFEVNYGTPMVPLDVLFGSYDDGSKYAMAAAKRTD